MKLPLTGNKFACFDKLLSNKKALAVTYDPRTEYIYWSEANFILRAKKNSEGHHLLLAFFDGFPNWLAIDWISGNLFWTLLKKRNIIAVSRADGSSRKTLVSDATNVVHIAINPLEGLAAFLNFKVFKI